MPPKGHKADTSRLGSSAAAIAKRRADVEKWLAESTPTSVIIERAIELFKVNRSTALRDIAAIRADWLAGIEREEPQRRTKLLGVLEGVVRGAIEDRAWSAAASAARVIARVMGLDRMTVRVEDAEFDPRTMTPQQREAEIRELLQLEAEAQRKTASGGN